MHHYQLQLQMSVVSFYDTPENAAKMIAKMAHRTISAVIFIDGKNGSYSKRIIG